MRTLFKLAAKYARKLAVEFVKASRPVVIVVQVPAPDMDAELLFDLDEEPDPSTLN